MTSNPRLRLVESGGATVDVSAALEPPEFGGNDGGREPPHNDNMEARVKALEDAIKNLPTKADFAELRADMVEGREGVHKLLIENSRWTHTALVSMLSVTVIGIIGLLFTIWNATKTTAPQANTPVITVPAPTPNIVINVPSAAPAPQQ